MAIEQQTVAATGMDGPPAQFWEHRRNGRGEIGVNSHFNILGPVDNTQHRAVRDCPEVRHGLGRFFAPEVVNGDGFIGPVEAPEPISRYWGIRGCRNRLSTLDGVSDRRSNGCRAGPERKTGAVVLQDQGCPGAARVGWRPACPGVVATRQAGFEIPAIGKAFLVVIEVQSKGQAELFQIRAAGRLLSAPFGRAERREKQCSKNRNDSDDDKQLDQRKRAAEVGPTG